MRFARNCKAFPLNWLFVWEEVSKTDINVTAYFGDENACEDANDILLTKEPNPRRKLDDKVGMVWASISPNRRSFSLSLSIDFDKSIMKYKSSGKSWTSEYRNWSWSGSSKFRNNFLAKIIIDHTYVIALLLTHSQFQTNSLWNTIIFTTSTWCQFWYPQRTLFIFRIPLVFLFTMGCSQRAIETSWPSIHEWFHAPCTVPGLYAFRTCCFSVTRICHSIIWSLWLTDFRHEQEHRTYLKDHFILQRMNRKIR